MGHGTYEAVERFRALLRAAIASAYAHQVVRGHSIDSMAYRLNWPPEAVTVAMWVSDATTLRQISGVCFAMDCEPSFDVVGSAVIIGVHPNAQPNQPS